VVGLGRGTTPAGDDFIAGGFIALRVAGKANVANMMAGELDDLLDTSLPAKAMIRAAARGACALPWHDYIRAVVAGDRPATQRARSAILSIGHSSGADALLGFCLTLRHFLNT
jgi:hypothetical protein